MRTLSFGADAYMVDHNVFPPRFTADEFLPTLATQKADMSHITTPIQYLTSLPEDIFAKDYHPPNNGIDYYDSRQTAQYLSARYGIPGTRWEAVPDHGYLLISVGPDGAIGAPSNNYLDYPPQGRAVRTLYIVYDPTNGTVSTGNIFRFMGPVEPMPILNPER